MKGKTRRSTGGGEPVLRPFMRQLFCVKKVPGRRMKNAFLHAPARPVVQNTDRFTCFSAAAARRSASSGSASGWER